MWEHHQRIIMSSGTFRNFYMELLMERSRSRPDLPGLYAFSSFFYKELDKKGYGGAKKWTEWDTASGLRQNESSVNMPYIEAERKDIFGYELLLIPIHYDPPKEHWCLEVDCSISHSTDHHSHKY